MNLQKIWLIAKREFQFNLRRRAFLFSMFGLPILIVGIMWFSSTIGQQAATDISQFKRVGVVDLSGVLSALTAMPKPFERFADEQTAERTLQSQEIDGYYVVAADYLKSGKVDAYFPRDQIFTDALASEFTDKVVKPALAALVGDPAMTARLSDPLKELSIYRLGSDVELQESALFAAIFVPLILGMLVFTLTMTTSQYLMQGLVEEKENRMMELFITSARPGEMLWGKLLGLGGLGLLQIAVWAIIGVGLATLTGQTNISQSLASMQITPSYLAIMLVYTLLGYFVYGAVMAGIGASVNAEQESRQLASLLSMVGILPVFFIFLYFTNPNGPVPVLLSMIPFTSPVGMILRAALTPVPAGEIVLSLLLLVVGLVVIIWISARVFRLGMLNYGKRLSFRDIWRAMREGRRAIVTAAEPKEVAS